MTSSDVRDVLDLGAAGPRPAKKQKLAAPRPNLKGLAREVQSLGGDNPIAIVPETTFFKKKRFANRKPVSKWESTPFQNSARDDGLVLRHWRKKIEPPPPREEGDDSMQGIEKDEVIEDSIFAKFNVRVETPKFDDEQYESLLKSEEWSRPETDYLVDLVQEYDLRWPVIWDRYEYSPPVPTETDGASAIVPLAKTRNLEELKARYYKVASEMLKAKTPLEQMNAAQFDLYEKMRNFNPAQEATRKKFAEAAFNRTREEAREEESLLVELKRIMARSEKMNEERRELYARLDAPQSSGNIGIYTSSQGLQQLLHQLMAADKSKKRKSMGMEASPAAYMNALQQGTPFNEQDPRSATSRTESISGPSSSGGLKKSSTNGPDIRTLTTDEERVYGVVHSTERLSSGPWSRNEKCAKLIVNKSHAQQEKINNVLKELGIPGRVIMPTAEVAAVWSQLLEGIGKLLDFRKVLEKASGELELAKQVKREREGRKEETGEGEGEGSAAAAPAAVGGDVKEEDSAADGATAGAASGEGDKAASTQHKRSASVMSVGSEKSSKRQKN